MLKKWIRNLAAALLSLGLVNTAMADRLQEILTAGVVRIGVPLDCRPLARRMPTEKPRALTWIWPIWWPKPWA